MNKVGHSVVLFCIGCNRDEVEAGEILEDTRKVLSGGVLVKGCAASGELLTCRII